MFMRALRAAAIAIVGFGIASPAYADAQVENAMKLWTGDLRAAYDQTVDLLGSGKINAGKDAVTKLQDLTYQMSAAIVVIRENANTLAPELGAAWTDTDATMNELHKAASALKAQVGVSRPTVDPLKSAFAKADEALKKSVEFTKAFGRRYGELMGGPVEDAKELFDGYLNEGYKKTIEYLGNYNTDSGRVEIDRLVEINARLYQLTGTASSGAASLARPLADLWGPAHGAVNLFQEEVQNVQEVVGESEYDLGDMQDAYADLSAAMATSYKEFLEFGNRLGAISDDWR